MTVKLYDKLALNQRLVLDLDFTEGTGIITRDKSKYRNYGTLNGGAAWVQLPNGRWVLDLDGLNGYMFIADSALFKPTIITIEYWFNLDVNEAGTRPISYSGVDNQRGWMIRAVNDTNTFNIHNGIGWVGVTSTGSMAAGSWHHVIGVYNKTDLRIYTEGLLACTPVAETSDISYLAPGGLYIGVREGLDPIEFIDGKIGRLRIYYNYALSAREVWFRNLITKWRYS